MRLGKKHWLNAVKKIVMSHVCGRDAMEPMRMIHMTRVVNRDDTCDNSSMAKRMPDKGALVKVGGERSGWILLE